jgi:hypothetical protein
MIRPSDSAFPILVVTEAWAIVLAVGVGIAGAPASGVVASAFIWCALGYGMALLFRRFGPDFTPEQRRRAWIAATCAVAVSLISAFIGVVVG